MQTPRIHSFRWQNPQHPPRSKPSSRLLVFLSSCIPVFLSSCILVFLYSCLLVFLYSCLPVFLLPSLQGRLGSLEKPPNVASAPQRGASSHLRRWAGRGWVFVFLLPNKKHDSPTKFFHPIENKIQKCATKSSNHGVILKNHGVILKNHGVIRKNHAMIPTFLSNKIIFSLQPHQKYVARHMILYSTIKMKVL